MSKQAIDPQKRESGEFPDPYYRYQMPIIEINKSTNKGRPVTYIFNAPEVASSLKIKPNKLLKLFSIGLGTSVNTKEFQISGFYETSELQEVLDKFIEDYLLCLKCRLPEVVFVHKKKKLIAMCKACGKTRTIVDDRRKSILEDTSTIVVKKKKKIADEKIDDEDVVWFTDTSDTAIAQRRKEELE